VRGALAVLLFALPAAAGPRDGAFFGAGAWFASAADGPARRDGALSAELDYQWTHAALAVELFGSAGFSRLRTTAAMGRVDFIVLSGPVAPFVGIGAGFFGQTLHCGLEALDCNAFSSTGAISVAEAGVLLFRGSRAAHLALTARRLQPLARSQPAILPPTVKIPLPVWLFGVRVLFGG
jgi:hypothetical protein